MENQEEVEEICHETPAKNFRDSWEWEEEPRSFRSKHPGIFPKPNYTKFKDFSSVIIFYMILDEGIITAIATKSNKYAMKQLGYSPITHRRKSELSSGSCY